ncbi:MAG: NAD(+)/NADH kinase [Solirubrobacterales bacterium]|nr:NAD(+)/NADH kinase [Solirubrobacterales bacterium]
MIANPRAMSLSGEALEAIRLALSELGPIELVETDRRGHATELCREAAANGAEAVVVIGGDGTMNEAANGLAGSRTALAPIPAGCTNVFARAIGLADDPIAATDQVIAALCDPRPRAVDLGLVNGRAFLFTSAVGFSAEVIRRMHAHVTHRPLVRQSWFAVSALAAAIELRGGAPTMRVSCEGRKLDGAGLVVQNASALTYMGSREVGLCEGAGLDTGSLSLAVLRRVGLGTLATLPARLMIGRNAISHPAVSGLTDVVQVEIEPLAGPLQVEADGEYLGEFESVTYSVAPGALRVLSC